MVASLLSLPHSLLPLPLPAWETPRESPQQEKSSCGVCPPGPLTCHTSPPHSHPTQTGLPALSPQPSSKLTLIITLALLAESHRGHLTGALLPLPPSLSGGPGGGLSVHTPILASCRSCRCLASPGSFESSPILQPGSAWRVEWQGLAKARPASLKEEHSWCPV